VVAFPVDQLAAAQYLGRIDPAAASIELGTTGTEWTRIWIGGTLRRHIA
jgi:hypothetical protein